MKKYSTLVLGLVMVSLVLAGCNNQGSATTGSGNGGENQPKAPAEESFTGNLKQIMGLGGAQKCTFTAEDNATGVVYTDGKKSRFEANNIPVSGFTADVGTPTIGSLYSINDGEYIYTWSSTANKGMKMKVTDQEMGYEENDDMDNTLDNEGMADESENISDENYEYNCKKWRVNNSLFVPPIDIEFQDLSAMMDNIRNKTGSMGSLCEMITDPAEKQECIRNWAESQQNLGE